MAITRMLMPDEATIKTVLLRLDPRLHRRVEGLAQRSRRSVHAQLLWLIERALETAEQAEGLSDAEG